MPAEPHGAALTGATVFVVGRRRRRVARQERREVRRDRDRTDAGAAAAVRDAERLVQVEVADVAAELARPGQPDERVEVRAVDVDLTAGLVHEVADRADTLLVDAVRRGVGDHDRRDLRAVLLQLGAQVVQVDRAVVGRRDDHHAHARERRRRRVGAVRGRGDQADVALVAAGRVVPVDGQQPGELALATRVRLHRHRGVAGDLRQPVLQLRDQLGVALRSGRWGRTGGWSRTPARRWAPSPPWR